MTDLHDGPPPHVRATQPPVPGCADARAYPLLLHLTNLAKDTPERARARDELVEMFLPLARVVARRFPPRQHGPLTFEQVAVAVLIQTVDRVDARIAPMFISHLASAIVSQLCGYERILSAMAERQTLETTVALRRAAARLRVGGGREMTLERIALSAGVSLDLAVTALRGHQQPSPNGVQSSPMPGRTRRGVRGRHPGRGIREVSSASTRSRFGRRAGGTVAR